MENMTAGKAPPGVTIRPYRALDHNACRRLWAEFVEHRDELYPTSSRRPADPGVGFEEYLTRLDLAGIWVAEAASPPAEVPFRVVGLVGLRHDGGSAAVDPLVVTRHLRGRGIGRALLATVADEARRRGLTQLTVSPPARDHAALRSLHAAGFGAVTSVTLSYPLRHATRSSTADESLDLYDLHFRS